MALQILLSIVMISGVVVFLGWPILNGVDERVVDAERAELEDAKQSKYREIKDAELEFKAGRMTEDQWHETDKELRREAMQILGRIDTLGTKKTAEPVEDSSAG
ncbi:MAG: hypothetical protein QM648_09600 [Solirubrobacterales bacterium]